MKNDDLKLAQAAHHDAARRVLAAHAALAESRQRHIASLADGGVGLAEQVAAAERTQADAEDVHSLLAARHRKAERSAAEARAAAARQSHDALAAQEVELTRRLNAAMVELTRAQSAYEAWRSQVSQPGQISVPPPATSTEGPATGIEAQVDADPRLVVDYLSLQTALRDLEAEARRRGFSGNKVERHEGKTYLPTAGRVRIGWDAATGAVTEAALLDVLAVEAAVVEGQLSPVAGATPRPLPRPAPVGVAGGW